MQQCPNEHFTVILMYGSNVEQVVVFLPPICRCILSILSDNKLYELVVVVGLNTSMYVVLLVYRTYVINTLDILRLLSTFIVL